MSAQVKLEGEFRMPGSGGLVDDATGCHQFRGTGSKSGERILGTSKIRGSLNYQTYLKIDTSTF